MFFFFFFFKYVAQAQSPPAASATGSVVSVDDRGTAEAEAGSVAELVATGSSASDDTVPLPLS